LVAETWIDWAASLQIKFDAKFLCCDNTVHEYDKQMDGEMRQNSYSICTVLYGVVVKIKTATLMYATFVFNGYV